MSAENIDELLEQLEPSPLVHFLSRLVGKTSFAGGWQERARCKDRPSWWFFPWKERLSDPWIRKARWECARCPVRRECLESAVRVDTIGVWGGTTRSERRAVKHLPLWRQVVTLNRDFKVIATSGPWRVATPQEWEPIPVVLSASSPSRTRPTSSIPSRSETATALSSASKASLG